MRPALVETIAVEMAPAGFDIRVHGTVVPKREIVVSAEVAGKVVRAAEGCRAGTYVKKDDFLLQIERTTFELEIKRLISQMKQVDVDRLQLDIEAANNEELIVIAKTDLAITERELQRLDTLATRKAVSASERDQAESAMMKAQNTQQTLLNTQRLIKARRERLDAEHDLTQAKLDLARHDLERTTITAPIDGVIAEQVVEENAFVQPGSPLLKITDTAAIEVKCCLRDEDLYWLWRSVESLPAEGQTARQQYHAPKVAATVTFTLAGRSYDWQGFLSRFEGVGIDEDTRTIPCRIASARSRARRCRGRSPRPDARHVCLCGSACGPENPVPADTLPGTPTGQPGLDRCRWQTAAMYRQCCQDACRYRARPCPCHAIVRR